MAVLLWIYMNYLLYSTTIIICFHKEKQLLESLCVRKGMPGLLRMYDDVGLVRESFCGTDCCIRLTVDFL